MTQIELNRAVSRATGEDFATIARLGFGVADPAEVAFDPEPLRRPQMVNWDRLDGRRGGYLPQRARLPRKAR